MKFEESSLTNYLINNLQPLTEADPLILADYVTALLKKDKPIKELKNLCAERLVEFLGQGTLSFVTKLFQALEDDSIVSKAKSLNSINPAEASSSLAKLDHIGPKGSSPMTDDQSPSGRISDSEEKEITDDDDDDRNHKHRRRETHSQSFEDDVQDHSFRRQGKKHNRPFSNGHMFQGESGNRSGLATPLGRLPNGRGRGRSSFRSQRDSRFTNAGTLDFHMAPPGPTPSLFVGRGLLNAASSQNASWGTFGLVPGMSNGGLDTLHPLLQGPLRPPMSASLGIGIPRQRCRDFEERGFCMRGDMCPMEHGVNRIVVEDVQSLSQFNLPVSVPSTSLLGKPAGTGSLPTVSGPLNLLTESRGLHGGSSAPEMNVDGLGMSRVLPGSANADDADLYDPDQPLWNNNCPGASGNAEPLWNSNGIDNGGPGRNDCVSAGSHGAHSSVWGRIGNSGNKVEMTGKNDDGIVYMGNLGNGTKEGQSGKFQGSLGNLNKRKRTDAVPKTKISASTSRLQSEPTKAQRTLFVNGIPVKNNKEEALLSHFKRFGKVVDIYIPLNSERAFVQFSTREEAESALTAPDAVMGNRFIKLWWANRDSVPANGVISGHTASVVTRGTPSNFIYPSSGADKGKENHPSLPTKICDLPSHETTSPAANVRQDTPSQKKLDKLELLKEEIRLKQQMLDKKRSEFRLQLSRLEKKASTVKDEATDQQMTEKHKVELVTDVAKIATPKVTSPDKAALKPAIEKMRDKNIATEKLASFIYKTTLSAPRSLVSSSYQLAPVGIPFPMNRFKLDNRPTTFRILPPLPADLANVAVLKEHFSTFGDVSKVELEEAEARNGITSSEPSENHSARISFTTRRSAERAFSNGKCCQGHNLQFSWLATSSITTNNSSIENGQTPTAKDLPDDEAAKEKSTTNSSQNSWREHSPTPTAKCLPDDEAPNETISADCTVVSLPVASDAVPTTGNEVSVNSEEIGDGLIMDLNEVPESIPATKSSCEAESSKVSVNSEEIGDGLTIDLNEVPESIPATMSSCEGESSKVDNSVNEDGLNIEFAE